MTPLARAAAASLVVLLFAPAPRAQTTASDDAGGLLKAAAQRYTGLRAFDIEGWAANTRPGIEPSPGGQLQFRFAVAPGGRMHEQLRQSGQRLRHIADGTVTITHLEPLNQWTRKRRVPPPPDSLRADLQPGTPGAVIGSFLTSLRTLADSVGTVRALPAETLDVAGRAVPCDVLEVTYARTPQPGRTSESSRRVWVARESGAVLQMHAVYPGGEPPDPGTVQITRFTRVALGGTPPDSLFRFTPPDSARLVRQFQMPGRETADLTGTRAADFTLRDLKGASHTLAKLRGKVVMLDFWASWCGPCRMTMPVVEKLMREYKAKGLVVYSVNVRESADVAGTYITRNKYTMPVLLDGDGKVSNRYQVTGIPSLVIVDRKGVIRAHLVGAHGEDDLRDALVEAGL
jgi:thiol-disulfide isomerase/thioredoxin